MIPAHIEEKLQMFQKETFVILKEKEQTELKERKKNGEAKISCTVQSESLIFTSPENFVLPYLDGDKKGAKSCADVFLYKRERNKGKWELHIMEFKKTINTSTIGKSCWQFTMGIYNARAIAAFLGMEIENIYLYSGFRNDKLTVLEKSTLIALRASNNREAYKNIQRWKEGNCELSIDGASVILPHRKICLDQEGCGRISI